MTDQPVILHDYWRSSASYRVRIALNVLGIAYQKNVVNLLTRDHKSAAYLATNPQGLVPTLEIDGHQLTQSLAIIEYLDETRAPGQLLPRDPLGRARVRALSYAVAMEIHPVCNMGVAAHVMEITDGGDAARSAWMRKFIAEGLAAFETLLNHPATGRFCHGDTPTMADFCLVPQVYNAVRWEADIAGLTHIQRIAAACAELPAFQAAHPDVVKD